MVFSAEPDRVYGAMSNWIERWSDIDTRLSSLLLAPDDHPNFEAAIREADALALSLLQTDADASLYWLFQLAASSTVGYSTSHALICWAICRLVGPSAGLADGDSQALGLAALTMNIAMTRLQDTLAEQSTPPTAAQREQIETHAEMGAAWLQRLGVRDAAWIDIVRTHHQHTGTHPATALLQAADRYTALISPRETRSGQCVTDSGRFALVQQGASPTSLGHALVRTIGICPPGTFVRLTDDRVAIVLRRSAQPGEPWVATVLDARGFPTSEPSLIDTSEDGNGIAAALVSRTVRVRLNHPRLLQLSRMALAN